MTTDIFSAAFEAWVIENSDAAILTKDGVVVASSLPVEALDSDEEVLY